MTKTASPTTYAAAGTTITYTYVVTKLVAGPDTSLNSIAITDSRLGVVCTGRSIPGPAAGGTTTCTINYVTTAADIAVASITNTATATGTISSDVVDLDPITAQATITNTLQPLWTLSKSASPSTYAAGQTITYSYILTNTGGVAISAIAVTDNRVAPVNCPATTLAIGASMTCSGSYTTTAADVAAGSITNTATATGTPAFGTLAPATGQATITAAATSGSITIVKMAIGGNRIFNFSSSVPGSANFSLTTVNGAASQTFTNLTPGTYTITEDVPGFWRLSAVTCSGDNGGAPTTSNLPARSVSIGLDSGESITCTFTNTFDTGAHIQQTQGVIRGFLTRRVMLLANDEPDRARFLRRLPGSLWGEPDPANSASAPTSAVTFSGAGGDTTSRMSFATSLSQAQAYAAAKSGEVLAAAKGRKRPSVTPEATARFDAWFEAHFNQFASSSGLARNRGHFNVAYLGADYRVTEAILIGALVQADWMGESSKALGTAADGKGVMAGPYLSARLTPHVYFDARVAWGVSNNNVNPVSLYQDRFTTDRWLAHGKLTGNWWMGSFRVTPSAAVTLVEEKQHSYTDTLGIVIPAQTVSLGRLAIGPEIAYRLAGPDGSIYEPHLQLRGTWDFNKPDAGTVNGMIVGTDSLRLQAQAGVTVRTRNSYNLRVVGQVDGIGSSSLRSYGGQIWVNVPFHAQSR